MTSIHPEYRDGRYWEERHETEHHPAPLTGADGATVLAAESVTGYLHGGCAALALALHAKGGLPLVGVRCYGIYNTSRYVVDHMAVRLPDGLHLDARGVCDDLGLIEEMVGGSFEIVELTRDEAIAIAKGCDCPFDAPTVKADAERILAALGRLPRPERPVLAGRTVAPAPAATAAAVDPVSLVQALHETYGWPLVGALEAHAFVPSAWGVRRPDGLLDFGYGPGRGVTDAAARALLIAEGQLDSDASAMCVVDTSLPALIASGSGVLDDPAGLRAALAVAAAAYAPLWPVPQPAAGDPWLILVHPGSACGSADDDLGRSDGHAARESLIFELCDWDGHLAVIHGAYSDELRRNRYQPLGSAVEETLKGNRANGHRALEVWGCDNGALDQGDAARRLVERFPALATAPIEVTGCWATTGDSGCVNSVAKALRLAGCQNVTISEYAVFVPEDEPDDEPGEDDLDADAEQLDRR